MMRWPGPVRFLHRPHRSPGRLLRLSGYRTIELAFGSVRRYEKYGRAPGDLRGSWAGLLMPPGSAARIISSIDTP